MGGTQNKNNRSADITPKNKALPQKKLKARGFLSGTGFTDSNLYLSAWMDNFDFRTPPHLQPKNIPLSNRADFRHYMFKITPKLKYEAHEECRKILGVYKVILKSIRLHKGVYHELISMKTNIEQKLATLQFELQKERLQNIASIKNKNGKFVTYGAEVQLQHLDSSSFLCMIPKCADISSSKIGYVCKLEEHFSSKMVF